MEILIKFISYVLSKRVEESQVIQDLTSLDIVNVKNRINIYPDAYSATKNTHAVVICTEWDEFNELDYKRIYSEMVKPAYIFDGRKILNHEEFSCLLVAHVKLQLFKYLSLITFRYIG